MITLVTQANVREHIADLARMFRLRHRIFVDEARWRHLQSRDGLEIDSFDTPDASYLLAKSVEGDVVGVTRFIPTLKPHLNSEVFSYLCDRDGVPRSATIWEASRLAVDPNYRFLTSGQPIAMALMCGWFEYALAIGVTHLTLVAESWRLNQMLDWKWDVRPLGRPHDVNGDTLIAVTIKVDLRTLNQHYENAGLKGPVITSGLPGEQSVASVEAA